MHCEPGAESAEPAPHVDLGELAALERLAAVEGLNLLDAPPQPSLDRLTRLAAMMLAAPAAMISLIADRQVAVSVHGFELTAETRETPLSESFCRYAVAIRTPLRVSDARAEPWVAGLASVRRGALRSYLGVPLIDRHQHALGTLCVFDERPREWPSEAEHILTELAGAVVQEFELRTVGTKLRHVTEDLAAQDERLRQALAAGRMGTWDWDLARRRIRWDEHTAALLALSGEEGDVERLMERVHAEDADGLRHIFSAALQDGVAFDREFRVVQPGGERRWLLGRASPAPPVEGRPAALTGVVIDVTEREEAAERLSQTLESITDGFFALDRQWRFTYVNRQAERMLGRRRETLLGLKIWEEFPHTERTLYQEHYERAVNEGITVEFEARNPERDIWVEVRAFPSSDGLSVYFRDCTERRARQAEREELLSNRARAVARAEGLLLVSSQLSNAHTPDDVVRVMTQDGFNLLGTPQGALAICDAEPNEVPEVNLLVTGYTGVTAWSQVSLRQPWPLMEAIRTGMAVFVPDRRALRERWPDLSEEAVLNGTQAMVALPLVASGRVLGAFGVSWTEPQTFNAEERALLRTLASLCAQALERARLYSSEVERLALAQDRERIARDLHDTVIQRLFGAGLTLQRAGRLIEGEAAAQVQSSVEELDRTVREIRSTIFDLQRSHRWGVGLQRHFSAALAEMAQSLDLLYELRFGGDADAVIPAEIVSHLLPTLREALTNVARHAGARRVVVTLTLDESVILEVVDDGVGIELDGRSERGQGLRNLSFRALSLGGDLRVERRPTGGTELVWRAPLGLTVARPPRSASMARPEVTTEVVES